MTSPNGEAVVRVENLYKRFGELEVLRGINMEVDKGEVVVIFGRSGSGKSTLLRCVNFLEDPTDGTSRSPASVWKEAIGPAGSASRSVASVCTRGWCSNSSTSSRT